jgi:hypothetical protein
MMINKINNTTINANPPPAPTPSAPTPPNLKTSFLFSIQNMIKSKKRKGYFTIPFLKM